MRVWLSEVWEEEMSILQMAAPLASYSHSAKGELGTDA